LQREHGTGKPGTPDRQPGLRELGRILRVPRASSLEPRSCGRRTARRNRQGGLTERSCRSLDDVTARMGRLIHKARQRPMEREPPRSRARQQLVCNLVEWRRFLVREDERLSDELSLEAFLIGLWVCRAIHQPSHRYLQSSRLRRTGQRGISSRALRIATRPRVGHWHSSPSTAASSTTLQGRPGPAA